LGVENIIFKKTCNFWLRLFSAKRRPASTGIATPSY
jgi:hypothetical protein